MEQNNQQPQTPAPIPQSALFPEKKPKSALGITGFVIGIVALATSFLPIINNFSAILAVVGFVFALIGVIVTVRGTKGGKGLAIAGVIICIVAFAAVLATQSAYSNAINEATSGAKATSTSTSDTAKSDSKSSDSTASQQTDNLSVGTTVNMSNGLAVTVTAVETGLKNYNGEEFTRITVSYANNGSKDVTFNTYDWKGQDAQGAQRNPTYIVGGDSADNSARLNSGTLTSGGTASGVLEFEGAISKAVYSPSSLSSQNNVTWVLG